MTSIRSIIITTLTEKGQVLNHNHTFIDMYTIIQQKLKEILLSILSFEQIRDKYMKIQKFLKKVRF